MHVKVCVMASVYFEENKIRQGHMCGANVTVKVHVTARCHSTGQA